MAEQEKKPGAADEKKFYGRFAKGATLGRGSYKSNVQGLESNTFDFGASSNPTKFSKLLKNIKNYIQKTYKDPEDMVKTIQQMKRVNLGNPKRPKKTDTECWDSSRDPDADALTWPYLHGKKTTSQ